MARCLSIPDYQYAFQWQRESVTGVQRVEKSTDGLKIFVASIDLPNCNGEVFNFVHHTSLKKILQELIVHNASPCFDLQYKSLSSMVCISIKGLLRRAITPEEHWNTNLFVLLLAGFNFKAGFHETLTYCFEYLVAIVFKGSRRYGFCFALKRHNDRLGQERRLS